MKLVVSEDKGVKKLKIKKEGKDTRLDTLTFLAMIVIGVLFWVFGTTLLKFIAIILIVYNFFRWLAIKLMEQTEIKYAPDEKSLIDNYREKYSVENASRITIYKVHEKFWKMYKPSEAMVRSSGSTSDSLFVEIVLFLLTIIFVNFIELLLYLCRTILHLVRPPATYYVVSVDTDIGSKTLFYFRTNAKLDEEEIKAKLEEIMGVDVQIHPELMKSTFGEFAKFVFSTSVGPVEIEIGS